MPSITRFSRVSATFTLVVLVSMIGITPRSTAAPVDASLSVIHVATDDEQLAVVDIYAGSMRIFNNLKPGQLRGVRITSGTYDLAVFRDGDRPGNGKPLLQTSGLELKRKANTTIALHRDSAGQLAVTSFDNGSIRSPMGQGRLTIRHIAVAPGVDVRLDGEALFLDLANAAEVSALVPAGSRPIDVLRSGTEEVLVTPRMIPVNRPINTIVYVWGSTEEGLRLAAQRVPLKR